MNDQLASPLPRFAAHVAQETSNAVHFVEGICEQPDLHRPGCLWRLQARDLAQQVPLLVLMKDSEVIGQQRELLRENRANRVKQAHEARPIDAPVNRVGQSLRELAVDAADLRCYIIQRGNRFMSSTTRRFFIGAATAAAASRVWGANDKINIAIVGLGGRGTNHLNTYPKINGARVAGLCDVNQAAREVANATLLKNTSEKAKEFVDMREAFADPSRIGDGIIP